MSWATVLFQQAEKPATKMWPDNKLPLRPSFNRSPLVPLVAGGNLDKAHPGFGEASRQQALPPGGAQGDRDGGS